VYVCICVCLCERERERAGGDKIVKTESASGREPTKERERAIGRETHRDSRGPSIIIINVLINTDCIVWIYISPGVPLFSPTTLFFEHTTTTTTNN